MLTNMNKLNKFAEFIEKEIKEIQSKLGSDVETDELLTSVPSEIKDLNKHLDSLKACNDKANELIKALTKNHPALLKKVNEAIANEESSDDSSSDDSFFE